jgi:ribonuclease HI
MYSKSLLNRQLSYINAIMRSAPPPPPLAAELTVLGTLPARAVPRLAPPPAVPPCVRFEFGRRGGQLPPPPPTPPTPHEQHVYTDASNNGGIGVVWIRAGTDELHDRLASRTVANDINTAELTAIFFAVLLSDPCKKLTVFTDSQSAMLALAAKDRARGGVAAAQLARSVLWLTGQRRAPTVFVKVKAHASVAGNEVADSLARIGRRCCAWPRIPTAASVTQYPSLMRAYLAQCGIDPRLTVLRVS